MGLAMTHPAQVDQHFIRLQGSQAQRIIDVDRKNALQAVAQNPVANGDIIWADWIIIPRENSWGSVHQCLLSLASLAKDRHSNYSLLTLIGASF